MPMNNDSIDEHLGFGDQRFRMIVESAVDYAIFTTTREGIITSWNTGATNIFGYAQDEILGNKCNVLFTDDDNAVDRAGLERRRVLIDGRSEDERWHMRKDGSRFWASGLMMALRGDDGEIIGFLKIVRDETARREAEDTRNRLLASERLAREEAERANRLKDEFLLTLSHELRTPLNAIFGWSHFLAELELADDEVRQAVGTIERNARLLTRLIEDMLDLSRMTTGKVELRNEQVDLCALTCSVAESMRPSAAEKGITLHCTVADRPAIVLGDSGRLQQIVFNLLSNAVKFTPPEGEIDMTVERSGNGIVLTIADTGIGIEPEFLPHLFERFRQADASPSRRYGGLGIGLAVVDGLVRMLGGSVSAHSEGVGRGATFVVTLPAHANAETAPFAQSYQSTIQSSDNHLPTLEGLNILVVEDEPDARLLFQRILERHGAEVVAVSSARDATSCLDTREFDVLVSDIGMPEENGLDLIRRVRDRAPDRSGTIPAVALTAFARTEDRLAAETAGYQRHVSKPIEETELVAVVASLAGRG
jgi:PAS domain S-box-containing protein